MRTEDVKAALQRHRAWCQARKGQWDAHDAAFADDIWSQRNSPLLDALATGWDAQVDVQMVRPAVRSIVDHVFYRGLTVQVSVTEVAAARPPVGREKAIREVAQALARHLDIGQVIDRAIKAALLYHFSGFKVGLHPTGDEPLARVWLDAAMPWELVLDQEAPSESQQRYRGLITRRPVEDVQRDLGIDAETMARFRQHAASAPGETAENKEATWVEVLELYDSEPYVDEQNVPVSPGSKTVYLVRNEVVHEIRKEPSPFLGPRGALAPIVPIVLESVPSRPQEGHPQVATVYNLQSEAAMAATIVATSVRRSAEQVMTYNPEQAGAKFTEEYAQRGHFKMIAVEHPDFSPKPVQLPQLPADLFKYWAKIEDVRLQSAGSMSPFAHGEPVQYITAEQTKQLAQYSANTLGHVRKAMDAAVAAVLDLAMQAMAAAMLLTSTSSVDVLVEGVLVTVTREEIGARGVWVYSVSDIAPTPMAEAALRADAKAVQPQLSEVMAVIAQDRPELAVEFARNWYSYLHRLYRLPPELSLGTLEQAAKPAPAVAPVSSVDPAGLADELDAEAVPNAS